jgi:hypothetical protein
MWKIVLRFGTPLALLIFAMIISAHPRNSRPNRQRDSHFNLRARHALERVFAHKLFLCAISFIAAALIGCGYAFAPPSPPPPAVIVTIQPTSASLFLGQTQAFQATVTGSTNTNVTWQVNGVAGGSTITGTVSSVGLFTAPAILPPGANVTVTTVSQANPKDSASVTVTLQDNIVVSLLPSSATVSAGAAQVFTASVTGTGSPSSAVTWSVNGIVAGNSTVGTIVANGSTTAVYTAPAAPPIPATVTVTATSVADTSKSANAGVTIVCSGASTISPSSANVALGATQSFTASFCPAPTSTIVWDVNGIPGGNATLGTIISTSANAAQYTAPINLPPNDPVTVHAVAGAATVSASVTIVSGVSVTVAPPGASVAVTQRTTLTPTVTGTQNTAVSWTVNGIPNGNTILGQICQPASVPCIAPTGPASGSVDFLAPAAVPASNPVNVTATSAADPTRSGTAIVIITGPAAATSVSISPPFALLAPSTATLSQQSFVANVSGNSNTSVTWTVQSAVPGQGCSGAACGSVDATGLYSAPTAAPSPNGISVIATSVADSTKSATANVSITTGPAIEVILPSSVMAGAVESFPFSVQGLNFVAGAGSAASTILINNIARSTTCPTANTCSTALNPTDVQSAATLTIQIQNPPPLAQLSNPVPFVIVPFDVSVGVIALSAGQPASTGTDIIVTEPTTAAASAPINVDSIGFLTANSCEVQGSPLTVTRPSSGVSTVSLCIHGNLLDPTFTYVFTGPAGGDIGVTASAVTGLFPNTIELDLQISSATIPGVRTLFITTLNNDRAAASAMLEVQ